MEFFFEIHKDLPREGPGDSDSTRQAFRKMTMLPQEPVILDVGSGPGAQTLDLAVLSNGVIHAVDTHQPFLDRLQQKVIEQGLSQRVKVYNQSMSALDFPPASFDLIWSEGAIYIMGFEAGLRAWEPLLKPGGYIAVTELTWLQPDPPAEVNDFWHQAYPGMKSLEENLNIIYDSNYFLIDYFALPKTSWTEEYYRPLQARIAMLREQHPHDSKVQKVLDEEQAEIDIYEKYHQWYGYVFYIMQNKS